MFHKSPFGRGLWGVALVLLLLVLAAASQIDDWSRDLTTNFAETAEDAANRELRPLEVELPPAETARRIHGALSQWPRWQFVDEQQQEGQVVQRWVRTTALWRFRDDVTVIIGPGSAGGNAGCRISATSRSRLGRGDLGQNPRNLVELMTGLRAILPVRAAP